MNQQMVIVRSKKDRSDVREMTEAMYRVVSGDFEIVQNGQAPPDPNDKTAEAIKKKLAAKDVAVENSTVNTIIEDVTDSEFATISDEPEQDNGPSLAIVYESLTGKAPDKRWKAARIQSEIDKLKQQ